MRVKDKESGEERKILGVGMVYLAADAITLSKASPDDLAIASGHESVKGTLKKLYPHFAPSMIESCLEAARLDAAIKLSALKDPQAELLSFANKLVGQWNDADTTFGGIIVQDEEGAWCDFFPTEDAKLQPRSGLRYPTFNEAVDEYFYRIDEARLAFQSRQKELAVQKKFDAIKTEQESRIRVLDAQIDEYLVKAQVIEAHVSAVEEAILIINTGLQNDLSWEDLDALVRAEKARGRPIAKMIKRLVLAGARIELALPLGSEEVNVEVDITLGGYANANRHYELRRMAAEKLARTRAAFDQAMRSAEAKVRADSRKEAKRGQHMVEKRKALWFEKYNWFISSDSYLVLSGKDMHQNEFLVKRMLKEGDAYVHADLTGASSVVVKNHRRQQEEGPEATFPAIPHRTLVEAGAFSLCFSKAWEAKITTSAWWVHAEQVSKTAPSGEYLGTGSFMVRGRKNFLPPTQLVMGFGFMFVLDETATLARRESRLLKEARRDSDAASGTDTTATSKYLAQLDIATDEEIAVHDTLISPGPNPPPLPRRTARPPSEAAPQKAAPEPAKKGPVRGKHGKQKKLKEKYRDQDPEEREARMALLQSAAKPKTASKTTFAKCSAPALSKRAEDKKPAAPLRVPPAAVDSPFNHPNHPNDPSHPTHSNLPDLLEPSIGPSELAVIDSLTGNPLGDETVVGCIAVAAPFMVLQHYKYRVKLMPGTLKRGSAVKTSLALIFAENKTTLTPRERELIRSVPDTDLNSTMPGKVRVVGSSVELSKIKRASKKKADTGG